MSFIKINPLSDRRSSIEDAMAQHRKDQELERSRAKYYDIADKMRRRLWKDPIGSAQLAVTVPISEYLAIIKELESS